MDKTLLHGQVMTVCGLIPGDQIGVTLPHEHVLIQHSEDVWLDDPELAVQELMLFRQLNGSTVVDLSNRGLHQEPIKLRDISLQSGLNIIAGCGYYKADWHPNDMDEKSIDDIENEIREDIFIGIDGTGIHAGIIGEIGVSAFKITRNEEKVVLASARAQTKAGTALSLHFDTGSCEELRRDVVDMIDSEGTKLERVILGHFFSNREDIDSVSRFAERGCCIEYDLMGHEATDATEIERVTAFFRKLIQRGFLKNILISQDVCSKVQLHRFGGSGYDHISKTVAPLLIHNGISEEEIHSIMVDNPQRLFSFNFD